MNDVLEALRMRIVDHSNGFDQAISRQLLQIDVRYNGMTVLLGFQVFLLLLYDPIRPA
jgi:hypothetical protein